MTATATGQMTKAVASTARRTCASTEFELPAMGEDEILAKVVSDSICMSSYKLAMQGADHKRVPDDVAENPTIIGHEFSGDIVAVGSKWADKYKVGMKFASNRPSTTRAAWMLGIQLQVHRRERRPMS